MDTTSLDDLLREGTTILLLNNGLRIVTDINWVVKGETRLSYTTIIRLIECCREYHWRNDIAPQLIDLHIDSTCKCIDGHFFIPIEANQTIDIIYSVKEIRHRSYSLHFTVLDTTRTIKFAEVIYVMVFINMLRNESTAPPEKVLRILEAISE